MSQTLSPLPTQSTLRVLCSDLYLAAFLLEQGASLHSIRFDAAARATLVVVGQDVLHHRKAYAAGDVRVSIPAFRITLNQLRDTINNLRQQNPRNQTFLTASLTPQTH